MDKHQKHAKLARPSYGEWGRNELAILGMTCGDIRTFVNIIIQELPQYKVAYADADHASGKASAAEECILRREAFAEYINKISYTQFNISTQPNPFQKRTLLNECDLVLVNGNHFTATKQILVIDEKKPLEKKVDQISNVVMILLKDSSPVIPSYLTERLPGIEELSCLSFNDTDAIIHRIKQYLQQQIPSVSGLVLSGGKSSRMGRDKGSIEYHDKSQREYVFELLSSFCSEVYVSCNAQQSKQITNTPKIEDAFLNLGPLSGILSAFQQNPDVAWLTVACDLPFLDESTIRFLIEHRNPSKMATAFWDADSKFPEPLVTIWEPKAYPVLLQFLAQGYSCPRKALINSDVELLRAPDTLVFKNINTTDEYQEAIALFHKQQNP